jgi:hypothetical protein
MESEQLSIKKRIKAERVWFMRLSGLIITALLFVSCRTDQMPLEPELTLAVEDVSCTEVWLKAEGIGSHEFILERDGTEIENYSVINENIIYDDSLRPNTSYSYRLTRLSGDERSRDVTATTLDTTSHDFQWEVIEFPSPYGSGVLRDVAIINENDIWAVGEIYADSAQPSLPYNTVHWDGQKLELMRIKTNACGGVDYPPIRAVFAFTTDDVLFAHIDGSITHYDGNDFVNDCSLITQLNGSINKMWGVSRNDFFVVSGNGFIAHYNGQGWQKLESPATDLPIQDIWGAIDPKTGEAFILCPASDKYNVSEKKLLQINTDKHISEIPWPFTDRDPYSTWFNSEKEIYVCGGGVIQRNVKGEYKIISQLPRIFLNKIRGNDINDIFVVGDFGLFAHYNGKSWWIHPDSFYGTFLSVDVKDNTIVAVGEQNAREGLVMVVKRN